MGMGVVLGVSGWFRGVDVGLCHCLGGVGMNGVGDEDAGGDIDLVVIWVGGWVGGWVDVRANGGIILGAGESDTLARRYCCCCGS